MSRRSRVATLVAAGLLGLGGCSSGAVGPPATLHPVWREVILPVPPGPAGRLIVRDAVACADAWYVVGAIGGPDGATRPAAWTSADGETWRNLALDPVQYYARRAILYSVGCRDGAVAVLGAKSGGAHGNPRTTAWHQRPDGSLQDVPTPFETFGGPNAIAVSRIVGGARAWMIAGGRTTGAAVWLSRNGTDFRLIDADPALSSDQATQTNSWDVTGDGPGWTAVGYAEVTGRAAPEPLAWASPDGVRWQRQAVPVTTTGFADLERVVRVGDRLLALGIRGERFGSWERVGDTWRATATFGRLDPSRSSAPAVTGLAVGTPGVLATTGDGVHVALWARDRQDRWHAVRMPARPLASGDRQTTVAAAGDRALLVSDDGTSSRVWIASW